MCSYALVNYTESGTVLATEWKFVSSIKITKHDFELLIHCLLVDMSVSEFLLAEMLKEHSNWSREINKNYSM